MIPGSYLPPARRDSRKLSPTTGADTGFGGGVPINFVNDNMWRKAPLETPKASQGEGTEGGGGQKISEIKCSRSDSEST